jgi:lipopolysaccharide transport system ATP-binding protein
MSATVIQVENLSKLYRLGEVGTGSLAHDVNRWWHRVRGKDDPYSQVGQLNDRTKKVESDWVWALKDINFEVKQGEVLGIIGRNGAGKSTLLKILSSITAPTSGVVKVRGRIAALLEVGTGFHPELTGRENIFLNGAILGMTKAEIRGKLAQIIDFSGCEAYLDTPVKRYSSGMQVRLAFAVAAHLEPEVLIVDEVLAVGDAEFQRKCIGRMSEVAGEGRTVLFVSHNLKTIRTLTRTSILLQNGNLCCLGETGSVLDLYESDSTYGKSFSYTPSSLSNPLTVCDVAIRQKGRTPVHMVALSNPWEIDLEYEVKELLVDTVLEVWICMGDGTTLCVIGDYDSSPHLLKQREPGRFRTTFEVNPNFLNHGEYSLKINACRSGIEVFANFEAIQFKVYNDVPFRHHNKGSGPVSPAIRCQMKELPENLSRLPMPL